jgi:hypothetical protein
MSPTPRIWSPEQRPADCFDWLTPEDVVRHALAAYYLACRTVRELPPGRRFVSFEGVSWATRESFGDDLVYLFEMRVKAEGYQLGINPDWSREARMLQKAERPRRPEDWLPGELVEPQEGGEHQP